MDTAACVMRIMKVGILMEQQGNLFVVQQSKNRSVFMDLMGVSEGKNKNLETFPCGLL